MLTAVCHNRFASTQHSVVANPKGHETIASKLPKTQQHVKVEGGGGRSWLLVIIIIVLFILIIIIMYRNYVDHHYVDNLMLCCL